MFVQTLFLLLATVRTVTPESLDVLDTTNVDYIYLEPRNTAPYDACYDDNDLGIQKRVFNITQSNHSSNQANPVTSYSSKLTFHKANNTFRETFENSEGQLALLAKNAYLEMSRIATSKRRPQSVTAMTIGNKVYLSSGLIALEEAKLVLRSEAWDSMLTVPESLRTCLEKCQDWLIENIDTTAHKASKHNESTNESDRKRASCGQCFTLYQYFQEDEHRERCDNAVFVTVNELQSMKEPNELKEAWDTLSLKDRIGIISPCGLNASKNETGRDWDCGLPASICNGGKSIGEQKTRRPFQNYFIGRWEREGSQNGRTSKKLEPMSDYEQSARYYSKSQVKLNTSGLILSVQKDSRR